MTGLLSPTSIQLLHKFKVCASKAVFRIVCCSWGLVLKREDCKRIKGQHGKSKGENKDNTGRQAKRNLNTAGYSKLKMRELTGF
jgi:hypothetical protein